MTAVTDFIEDGDRTSRIATARVRGQGTLGWKAYDPPDIEVIRLCVHLLIDIQSSLFLALSRASDDGGALGTFLVSSEVLLSINRKNVVIIIIKWTYFLPFAINLTEASIITNLTYFIMLFRLLMKYNDVYKDKAL